LNDVLSGFFKDFVVVPLVLVCSFSLQLIRKLLSAVLIVAVILPASFVNAAGDYRSFHPNQIVITENTPLYDIELSRD
jgi:hypothetical protein